MRNPELLGGLGERDFLARHWQKRPLLVRAALPRFRDPLTAGELAELACRDDVESRLVRVRGAESPFEVTEGPQQQSRLRRLPQSDFTLLVRHADHHVAALADLLDAFDFVPRWRMDDVMVSFSTRGGTVGPHIDNYDVFLIQGAGRRRWEVQRRPDRSLRQGLDLRVLRHFAPEEGWILEPGDMLYVPPGVAHHGVAIEKSFTYSVGFRAPSERALVAAFEERLFQEASTERLYSDPDLRRASRPGLVSAAALARLQKMLRRSIAGGLRQDLRLEIAAGLTRDGASSPPRRPLRLLELRRRLRAEASLVRHPAARAAYVRARGGMVLFVDGQAHRLAPDLEPLAGALTGVRHVPDAMLAGLGARPDALQLLLTLVNAGAFGFEPSRARPATSRRG